MEQGVYFKITNIWFEKSEKYGQHTPHTHGSRGFSCVLFVNYDREEHKPTVYMNPFTSYFYGTNPDWTCPEVLRKDLCFVGTISHRALYLPKWFGCESFSIVLEYDYC